MTSTQPVRRDQVPSQPPRRTSRLRTLILLAVVVGVVGGAGGLWYYFLRPTPAAVSLSSLPPTASSPAASASVAAGASSTAGSSAAPASPGAAGGLDGTWTVDTSVGTFSDFSSSFVGYRVREVLVNVGAKAAVGRTPDVTGTLTFSGKTVSAVEMTADLTTLQSDSGLRDGQLSRQAIETGTFPNATFKLTTPIVLDAVPTEGQTVKATATGDFTLHGVTKSVQIAIEARLSGNVVTVVGSLPVLFADYDVEQPRSQSVLSIEDNGVMEFQVHFSKA